MMSMTKTSAVIVCCVMKIRRKTKQRNSVTFFIRLSTKHKHHMSWAVIWRKLLIVFARIWKRGTVECFRASVREKKHQPLHIRMWWEYPVKFTQSMKITFMFTCIQAHPKRHNQHAKRFNQITCYDVIVFLCICIFVFYFFFSSIRLYSLTMHLRIVWLFTFIQSGLIRVMNFTYFHSM